jgi:ribosomal protein S18 acetylase RimI-like enzyme
MLDEKHRVRRMRSNDLVFASNLIEGESWDIPGSELERLLSYEPEGCFIAEYDGEPVGMVTSTVYGPLGWIGCLIVEPESRQRGIGYKLMQQAVDYLGRKGVETIKLEAEQRAVPLYKRLGFVDECRSLRFEGMGARYASEEVVPMKPSDLNEVSQLDLRCFGADRSKIIYRAYRDFPDLCFVSYDKGGLAGYVMAKSMTATSKIGPWCCRPDEQGISRAEPLFQTAITALCDKPVSVGVIEKNEMSLSILSKYGFRENPCSVRMYLGANHHSSDPLGEFAIGSAPKG